MPLLIGAAVAGVAGLGATAYGASQAGKVTKYDQNKIRKDLAPWQQDVDTMRGQAQTTWDQSQQFFDPRSDYYNQQRQMMREQIASQQANVVQQQNQLMAQRGMGGGGISGLLGAVSANQAGEQTRQGMLGMQQQGLGMGMKMAGMAGQMQQGVTAQQAGISENIAQAYLANVDAQNAAQQARAAGWMGMGQGLLGAAGTMAGGYKPGG